MSIYTYYTGSPLEPFFEQDQDIDGKKLPAVLPRFGLVDTAAERWANFWEKIKQLNKDGAALPEPEYYKVFFLGRHGEGVHNIAADKYLKDGWMTYWSHGYTDGVLTWGPDPSLTQKGYCDAELVRLIWAQELQANIGLPQTTYCSPFTRTLCTNTLTFNTLDGYDPKKTLVVEKCRGRSGVQTPEQRRSKSYISSMFPTFTFEPNFRESDPIWDPATPETGLDVEKRVRTVLDGIFSYHRKSFVSITTHDDFIDAFCRVIGRPLFDMKPGGVLPVIVCKKPLTKQVLSPGIYYIYSTADPRLGFSLVGDNCSDGIPDDSIIADVPSTPCEVSLASEGRYHIRMLGDLGGNVIVQKSPLGLSTVHVDELSDLAPEYVIDGDDMNHSKIHVPSADSDLVFTYTGYLKQVSVTVAEADNASQYWCFQPLKFSV